MYRSLFAEQLERRDLLTALFAFSKSDFLAGSVSLNADGSLDVHIEAEAEELSFELTHAAGETQIDLSAPDVDISVDTGSINVQVDTPDTDVAINVDPGVGDDIIVAVDDGDTDFDFAGEIDETSFEFLLDHNADLIALDAAMTDTAISLDFGGTGPDIDIDLDASVSPIGDLALSIATIAVPNVEVDVAMTADDYEVDVVTDEGALELAVDTVEEIFSGAFVYDDLTLLLVYDG